MRQFRRIFINPNPSPIRKCCILLFLILSFGSSKGMVSKPDSLEIRKNFSFSAAAQYGRVLATNPYLKTANAPGDKYIEFEAVSFQILRQTTGDDLWERDFGYPSYGLGIYSARFIDNNDFGAPIAVYGVFKGPFKRWNKFSFNYESGFGLTFNWHSFNPSQNDYNPSLGAKESVFIDLGINLTYELSRHFDLGLGYSFTHFSNGALKSPNMGLNTFSPKVSLSYTINRVNHPLAKPTLPFYIRKTSIDFLVFGGVKNVIYPGSDVDTITKYKGVYYPVFGVMTVINRRINNKSKLGIGMTLGYDGSDNSAIFVDKGKLEPSEGFHANRLSVSIFPSYELVINKLSVVIQPGFYIIRKQSVNRKPMAYQRLALHYQLNKNLFAGIGLHAYNYHVSDFIEWTMGYRLNLSH